MTGQVRDKMSRLAWVSSLAIMASLSTGCLEPQSAPDLKQVSSADFTVTTVAKGLDLPWSVAELPGGDFLVTEKKGVLWRVSSTSGRSEIQGIPKDIFTIGQGGLLDVVHAPDYQTSGEIYLSYTYGTNDANGTALMRATMKGDALKNITTIFRASPSKAAAVHFGGKLAFLPDDTLVLTLGDGFSHREEAQKPDSHFGKLVRLMRDGGVPEDNPYVGKEKDGHAFKPHIYSIGHRNVQGLAVDTKTGMLWQHEHGPRGGDELNQITPGANYGWPVVTKGRDYQGARISPFEEYTGMADPIHDWVPSIAPSGLAIYRGDMFPDWNGDALIGGLASQDLRRVDLNNGKSVGEEDLFSDLKGRVRDVRVASDGAVLVLIESQDTDGDGEKDPKSGQLLRITPK